MRKEKLPAQIYEKYANIVKDPNMIKNAQKWIKVLNRAEKVANSFKFFASNEWFFETQKVT